MAIACKHSRPPAVAGMFYPSDPISLKEVVRSYLDHAGVSPCEGEVVAVVVPHAGYVYSGEIAAHGYRALEQADYDTVVIIGHDFGSNAPGISAIFSQHDAYETPLGTVEVDVELQRALQAELPNSLTHSIHAKEHTVEVHLPFLQSLGKPFKIVPMLFGEVTPAHCRQVAEALLACQGNRRIVVIASSDMTHYPPYELSREIDDETLELIAQGELTRLCLRANGKEIPGKSVAARNFHLETPLCATGGVCVAMLWAQAHGADRVQVLSKGSSGDAETGRRNRVVGYGSVAFVKTGKGKGLIVDGALAGESQAAFSVSPAARQALLDLVRCRIKARAEGASQAFPAPKGLPELQESAAAFVTLTKNGRLRGCIGTTAAQEPLWDTISYFAEAAAFSDPRFESVTTAEVADLRIEISVLSPLKPCKVEDIVPFQHGVMIRSGMRSGLFLPQVWEQLPRLEDFMGYLCSEKAGLPPDAWKNDDVKLYQFTVVSFKEE